MNWNFNGQTVETFAIETDANNHLTSIANSNYRLDLTYDLASEKTESGLDLPLISEIIRMGPGFAETLTPRYVTPADGSNPKLDGIEIVRHTNGDLQSTADDVIIIEDYDTAATGLPTALRRQVDGVMIVDVAKTGSPSEEPMRFESLTSGAGNANETYDEEGSLTNLDRPGAAAAAIQYDAFRRIRGITQNQAGRNYAYDMKAKRIREYQAESGRRIVYAYSGSRVIAIGTTGIDLEQGTAQAGDIIWTHAIGYGPFGPAFVKNLDGQGFSYFIFSDHLGTPFAYHNPVTDQTYYTPYNPWGELLAQQPNTPPAASGQSAPATPYGDQQAVTTAGFSLPADHIFDISPIALAGHLIDHQTGLIYMHNRYYSPRLGHFLTPDFRLPNLLDCSSFKEPYAYATGNPISYWDPNGLSGWFFDGTWNDAMNPEMGAITNVAKLYFLYDEDKKVYAPGVGTGLGDEAGSIVNGFDYIVGGGGGFGARIRLEYMWVMFREYYKHQIIRYLNGDKDADLEIDIFGFSRGASMAKHFANVINDQGVEFEYKGEKFTFYPVVRYLGLFDTVGSYARPGNDNEFDWFKIVNAPNVRYIRHMIAKDELRRGFPLTSVLDGYPELLIGGHPRVIEHEGVGVHSDIGGGYEDDLLSHTALRWMRDRAVEVGVPFKEIEGWDSVLLDEAIQEEYMHNSIDDGGWKYYYDRFRRWQLGEKFKRKVYHSSREFYENKRPYKKIIFSRNSKLLELLINEGEVKEFEIFYPSFN